MKKLFLFFVAVMAALMVSAQTMRTVTGQVVSAADGEALVVIVNFGDDDSEVSVNIPRHAFGVLGFPEGVDPEASELLAGANGGKTFASSCPFVAEVPAHGAAIWKICSDRIEPLRPAVAQKRNAVKKN